MTGPLPLSLDQSTRGLRVPDGQPAGRVEEVQVVRVDGKFSRLTFFLETERIFPAFGLPPHLG